MLENLSFLINGLNFFKLKCERDEFGFYGSIQLQYKGKKFVDRINGKDIYVCFRITRRKYNGKQTGCVLL